METFEIQLRTPAADKIREAVFERLSQLPSGWNVDLTINDVSHLVTVIVCGGRTQDALTKDLENYLGHHIFEFIVWLWDYIKDNIDVEAERENVQKYKNEFRRQHPRIVIIDPTLQMEEENIAEAIGNSSSSEMETRDPLVEINSQSSLSLIPYPEEAHPIQIECTLNMEMMNPPIQADEENFPVQDDEEPQTINETEYISNMLMMNPPNQDEETKIQNESDHSANSINDT